MELCLLGARDLQSGQTSSRHARPKYLFPPKIENWTVGPSDNYRCIANQRIQFQILSHLVLRAVGTSGLPACSQRSAKYVKPF
jgi:hypothetical protein